MTRVAILGGGVGGLSAAHELAKRGFEVTVFEARGTFGGKARSIPVEHSGTGGRRDLPAEHGFRFFPGFYQHVTATMKEIPCGDRTVYDNLTPCRELLLAQAAVDGRDGADIAMPAAPPKSLADVVKGLRALRTVVFGLGISASEFATYVRKLLQYMTMCDERRLQDYEDIPWWDYAEAERMSDAYQKFLAGGLTRTLVAAKAKEMSTRTGGTIMCQLVYDTLRLNGRLDNVLNGPTSEVWIDPWLDLLGSRGVTFRPNRRVTGIGCDGKRITSVTFNDGAETIDAKHFQYFVAALPAEKFHPLVTDELRAADSRLGLIKELKTDWMTGVMFYLDTDDPVAEGHIVFADSPWALSAISQQQFWNDIDLEDRGDGRVEGILSVDVSAWDEKGLVTAKIGKACSKEEIFQEVWAQMKAHLPDLNEANVIGRFLDPAIEFPNAGEATNTEPLLINTAGSWQNRPDATTAIPNLFLAADFVRTNTDLATMEGANEAAKAAVNGILAAEGAKQDCVVRKLHEPWVFWPFRQFDRIRFKYGRKPAKTPFLVTEDVELKPRGLLGRGAVAVLRRRNDGAFL